MSNTVTANELKTKGISVIREATMGGHEVIITVRGKRKYVVMTMMEYNHLRECELEAALYESNNDIAKGKFIKESVEDHIKRVTDA